MDSYDVLVIILSVALALSILVWLTVGVLVVQILKRVKSASETAQSAVENVEQFTEQLKKAGKVSAAGSVLSQIAKAFKR